MPRQARLDYPGCLHHIINRGIEKRSVFLEKADYQFFIDNLSELVKKGGFKCYAWVLMPAHFHLLIETNNKPIAKFMSSLQTRYAIYFNAKYKRFGRLFQNRYKSTVCDKKHYLKDLIAYIHLNPLRSKIIDSFELLSQYKWSGHRTLIGEDKNKWQAVSDALRVFDKNDAAARTGYMAYLREKKNEKRDFSGGGLIRSIGGLEVMKNPLGHQRDVYDSRVLGDGNFIKSIMHTRSTQENERASKHSRLAFSELVKRVSALFDIDQSQMRQRGKSAKKVAQARAVVSYLSVEYGKNTTVNIAEQFNISQPAVSKLCQSGAQILAQDKQLEKKILQ